MKITALFGSYEILQEAKELVNNEQSQSSIDRLMQLYELLKVYEDEKYISFDLGLVSKYHYYTGIIFKGYTYGTGDAIVTGGRYDSLLSYFGKNSASIGFVINVDGLMQAMASRKLFPDVSQKLTLVVYEAGCEADAIRYAKELRSLKKNCELHLLNEEHDETFYLAYAKQRSQTSVVKLSSKGMKELYKA